MSPPSLECHPHHCPIQASELAETRNEKAAFLSLAPLPITLKKGILLEKTPGDLSVWKGKGHSEQRPRDSHLFGRASSLHPVTQILTFCHEGNYSACGFQVRLQRKQMQYVIQVFSRSADRSQMQVHVPGLPAQLHVCHCQLGQLHGQTRGGPWQVSFSAKTCFSQLCFPRPLHYKPMRVDNNNSLGQGGNIQNKCPAMLAILIPFG